MRCSRSRVELAGWEEKDGKVFITVTSAKPIDERMTRYIDRSSVFEGAQVAEKSADGMKLMIERRCREASTSISAPTIPAAIC